MNDVFHFSEHLNEKILIGAYRPEKKQLSWILGENPVRVQKMYNIRHNADLFANRNGGDTAVCKVRYILLYNGKNHRVVPKLFTCVGFKILDEVSMQALGYPNPNGNYIVYELGEELPYQRINFASFLKNYKQNNSSHIPSEPINITCEKLVPFSIDKIAHPRNKTSKDQVVYKTIDLFAGIGGIRRGFDNAFGKQCETVFVSEWDEPAQKTYKANYPMDKFPIAGDITIINEKDIPSFDICLAGFPCQAFSMAGKHQGFNDDYHGKCRGTLFLDVARICEYHKPKVIFCENVKGLTIHDKGRTFQVIRETFENLGYKVFYKILNSKDFGVPQQRERIYIVCFRNDIAPDTFTFPEGSKDKVCLKDILEDAPIPSKYYLSEKYLETLRAHRARHEAAGHGFGYIIRPLDGIAGTIVCGGMGKETNLIIDNREHSLTPSTHIKGEINKEGVRKMTPREWARLQGYPDSFILPLSDVHLYKQFGNSVSVPVIEAIAKEIKKVLK